MKKFRIYNVKFIVRKTAYSLLSAFITFYILHSTFYIPAQAVDLASEYGFGNIKTLGGGLGYLISPAFAIAGTALVIYFLIGSFKILTSDGDKNNIAGGKDMIVHAIIGFILLITMFLILQFIPTLFGIDLRVIKSPADR